MPYIIVGALVLLLAAVLLTSYISYRMAFYRGKNKVADPYGHLESEHMKPYKETTRTLIDRVRSAEGETVSITSHDGLRLFGRYYHQKDGAPIVIQLHGYKSTPYCDFAGGYKIVTDSGLNLLHCEQRAHESSEGKTITYGILESEDCVRWVEYLTDRFGKNTKIILCGISMGAATVLMAAGKPLPESVVGVIADSPYSSPVDIILKVAREDMHLPTGLLYPFLLLGARLFGGFDLKADSPIEAVKRAKVPILLFHGKADGFVPHEMSVRLYEAARDKISFHSFDGAHHGMCYMVDTERYTAVTNEFLSSLGLLV